MGAYDGSQKYDAFCRFVNVSIPAGATIISAKLQFRSYGTQSGATCNLKIHCEDANSPTAPTSWATFYARTLTTGTNWNSVSSWAGGTWYDTGDFKDELQTIIDRVGWAENNSLNVFIKNNSSSNGAYRAGRMYEYASGDAPKLIVTYTP